MVHGEYLGGNPFTGRKVWLVRHIIGEKYGDPWDWSVVVVKPHFFTRTAILKGAKEINTHSGRRALQMLLADMGFQWAKAHRRNGLTKRYRLVGNQPTEISLPATPIRVDP